MPGFSNFPTGSKYAWWKLNSAKKQVLQKERLGSRFGGETAAGIGAAPYFWSQEYGNERAAITAQHFAERSWEAFQVRVPNIISEVVREVMGR